MSRAYLQDRLVIRDKTPQGNLERGTPSSFYSSGESRGESVGARALLVTVVERAKVPAVSFRDEGDRSRDVPPLPDDKGQPSHGAPAVQSV